MMRMLGLGDNVADKYMHTKIMYPGGNAMNVAAYAKLAGADAAYMGNFGDDEAAKHVYESADTLGLDMSRCRFYRGRNGAAKVRVENGDRVFLGSNKGGISKEHPLVLTAMDIEYISGFDVVHTSMFSYIEAQLPVLSTAARFVSMDFSNSARDDYLQECCPYIDCACISCGEAMAEMEISEWIRRLIGYGCRHIVIATRGSKGAVVYVDGKVYRQSPCLVKARDTMGAGDSFISCFLVNYAAGMKNAVDFSEASGGDGIVTIREYKDLVIKTSLYQAAVFAAENCRRDGAFGFGRQFEEE